MSVQHSDGTLACICHFHKSECDCMTRNEPPRSSPGSDEVMAAAKRMQAFNALTQLVTIPWDDIDAQERNHWIGLACVAVKHEGPARVERVETIGQLPPLPSSDIVDRLRNARPWVGKLGMEAADEIERLRGVAQASPLPPVPIEWCRPQGATFEEMRANVWKTGLADKGDTVLVWVNEGDFLHAQIVCGAKEHKLPEPSSPPSPVAGEVASALNKIAQLTNVGRGDLMSLQDALRDIHKVATDTLALPSTDGGAP